MRLGDLFRIGALRQQQPHLAQQFDFAQAYQEVFPPGNESARIVLHDILRAAGVLDENPAGATETAIVWNDGRRSLGNFIMKRLGWSYGELMKFNQDVTALQLQRLEQQAAELETPWTP